MRSPATWPSLAVSCSRFGLGAPRFPFPFGIADADLVEAAPRWTDVVCALTTQSDLIRPGADPFGLGPLQRR